jgi:hypothetical protein
LGKNTFRSFSSQNHADRHQTLSVNIDAHDAYEFVLSTLTSLPDSNHEAFLNRAHSRHWLVAVGQLTWPSLCISNAALTS